MNELEPLDPVAKELLDAARGGHAPPFGGRDRVRKSIITRVGVSAFAGTALASAWVKVVVPLVLLAVGGSSAYFIAHRAPAPVPVAAVPAPIVDDRIAAPIVTATLETHVEPVDTIAAPAPKPTAIVRPVVTAAPVPTTPSIEEETSLLLTSQGALREGDAARALALLDDHARRFPNGALAEERDASRVLALCALGRTVEAKTAGQTFLAAHPRSPAAARVRASCGGS